MNNITSGVCENWNTNTNTDNQHPSMVSFVGLQNNTYKQLWDWETNTQTPTTTNNNITHNHHHNNNVNPFITTPTSYYDYANISSLSSQNSFNDNFIPSSQFSDYPGAGYLKKEDDVYGGDGGSYYSNNGGRIGLNLGHRTYFSSRETALIDRLFRRPRGFYQANQVPRCQAEGCKIDLTNAKHYHRRHKVCEFHSKATKVVAAGLEQRFCQQCSRFHVLAEFDQAKRSCRKRLADHNRRRRKPQIGQPEPVPAQTAENASSSRSEHKEGSLSSSANLPLMISTTYNNKGPTTTTTTTTTTFNSADTTSPSAKTSGTHFTHGPGLSLGAGGHDQDHHVSSLSYNNTTHHQRPFIFNQHSPDMFHRDNSVAQYHHHGVGSGPNQGHHQQVDLQSLLHMRQNMFEVELLQ